MADAEDASHFVKCVPGLIGIAAAHERMAISHDEFWSEVKPQNVS
jgi:hypothetical protein